MYLPWVDKGTKFQVGAVEGMGGRPDTNQRGDGATIRQELAKAMVKKG